MSYADLIEQLAQHKTLGAAPREELAWLAAHGTLRHLDEGEVLTHKGAVVEGLYAVLTGHIAIFVDRGAGRHKVMEWRAGDVTGILPYSRMTSPPGDTVAQEACEVLALPRDLLTEMIRECHQATSILVHKMIDRARHFTSNDLHDEKMASLGKLSAGLAHELNNPAAAIARSAVLLENRLEEAERATRVLGASRLTDVQIEAIDMVRSSCGMLASMGVLSPIQRVEREEAIADWLDDHGLDAGSGLALADTGVTIEALDRIAASVDGPALDAVLHWAAAGCSVRELASEIQDAAMRISGLVQAIKGFTHMDQATVAEPVDLASSLGNTVTILRSKARARSIAVAIDVEPDLPAVRGFVGELNQVWANLIDNALDAVGEGGRVDVNVRRQRQRVTVSIVDNGPGIPPEIRARMFDPFFTTKPVGKGTGLGLDIVRRLLTHNDAEIDVESVPGRTEFCVALPLAETGTIESRS
ncbi:Alkaline phosphatase synthesis sensor protein PhoR [Luteitalea pratensis]|uniref:histidine kinase n=1 Tax=Luteitalea pratensis TaxID=1855912 RepID=A0A143PTW7_LUTPR|nr:ATP-binding protein [Luteitalea pratensis]AMY11540.1 Alkaline phosphatase synthesis sensor protein PhoR [Luteitalea pratensis]